MYIKIRGIVVLLTLLFIVSYSKLIAGDLCGGSCAIVPSVDAGQNDTICYGEKIHFVNASAIDLNDGLALTDPSKGGLIWFHNGQGILDNSTILNPIYTPDADDYGNSVAFTLIGYSTESCQAECPNDTSIVSFYLREAPDAGADVEVCENSSVTISGASVSPGASFSWSALNGAGTLLNDNSITPIYMPDTIGGNWDLSLFLYEHNR